MRKRLLIPVIVVISVFVHVVYKIYSLHNNTSHATPTYYFSENDARIFRNKSYRHLQSEIVVVGSGLSGAVLAYLHATVLNYSVLVIEQRDHIGGNCYDYRHKSGILVPKYGHHTFYTNDEKTWDFISQFTKWLPYKSRLMAFVEDKYVPMPPNIDTVNLITGLNISTVDEMKQWIEKHWTRREEFLKGKALPNESKQMDIYKKVIEPFARNYFPFGDEGREKTEERRFVIRNNWETRFYPEVRFQGIPRDGYTEIINKLLSHPNIKVLLDRKFALKSPLNGSYEMLYYTGRIDEYFVNKNLPKLEYTSVNLEKIELSNTTLVQPFPVMFYLQGANQFTKIVDYKHFTTLPLSSTVIIKERLAKNGTPIFPIRNLKNMDVFKKYQDLARTEENESKVRFIGGLTAFKYQDMATTVSNAIDTFEKISGVTITKMSKPVQNKIPSLSLLVSHCKEDISWIERDFIKECARRKMNIFIYEKCNSLETGKNLKNSFPDCNVHQTVLPNMGREGHSWIHHLLTKSLYFQDVNLFLQGGKECDSKRAMNELGRYNESRYIGVDSNTDSTVKSLMNNYTMLMAQFCAHDWLGYSPKAGPGLCHWFKQATRTEHNCLKFRDSHRGEMIVSGALLRRVLSKNTKFLVDMYNALSKENNPLEGHFMERLWVVLFRWPYLEPC